MLHLDLPDLSDLTTLVGRRADACVSIYLATTPQTQDIGAARIALGNLGKEALAQLDAIGFDKRRRAMLAEQLDDLADDEAYWRLQARSLAILVTPDGLLSYRLPHHLTDMVQVSDRFHLKPLLRAVTFPHRGLVLALAEHGPRLVEILPDHAPTEIKVSGMPKDAGSATGRASVNDRSPSGRLHGAEGQRVLLRQYLRAIDAALRPVLKGRTDPLIIAATEPLRSLWPSVDSYPHTCAEVIGTSPGELTPAQLADAARPILDGVNAARIAAFRELFAQRAAQGRAITDLAHAARAATFGAIDTLLIDIDEAIPGTVDAETGAIVLADHESAKTYGVVDEIAGRTLLTGGTVLGVRRNDIPEGASLAAVLRYPI